MLKYIAEEQIVDRIKFENPWWVDKQIEKDYNDMPRRAYFDIFKPLAYEKEIRRAVVLMGPRRVGKTVMLHHLIQDLIENGIDPRRIVFITIENPVYNNISLEDLFKFSRKAVGEEATDNWIIIFDEIQYLKDWEVHLKSLVDSYRNCKFIVSGSAAAALRLKSIESGAGRFSDFMLPPLTFHEYISLKELDQIIVPSTIYWQENISAFYSTTHLTALNKHFHDYINFGGYPEVIFSQGIQSNPGRYIRQDIIDKVLLRDLPSLYGIRDVQELNSFFTTIAYNTANEFSYEKLSGQSGIQKPLAKKYIEYLEAAFLVKLIKRVDQAGRRFKRENFFKLYLTNPSLRSALFSPISQSDDLIGNMVETAVYSQWMHREWFTPWYARWHNGEVDMIGISERTLKPTWALEIKWSNRYFEKPSELKSLIKFCKQSKLKNALVTTIDKEGVKKIEGIDIQYIPASTYAYTIGRNTLIKKKVK